MVIDPSSKEDPSDLKEVERIAQAHNVTPSQVALAWIIARPGITTPIASATSVEQVYGLIKATELKLSDEEIAALNKVSEWRK